MLKILKTLIKTLTGKNCNAKTVAGAVKYLNDNLTVTVDGTSKVITLKVKS